MSPTGLGSREIAHTGLSDLQLVSTMHERKALMASLADGPGFAAYGSREVLLSSPDPGRLLDALAGWQAPSESRWSSG
ncbi:MAG: hypothetical protein ACR2HC_01585 [Thermoleophilaceae bacterium]